MASGVRLIVVPYDSGHRGARMGAGPERLLALGIVDALRAAAGDVRVVDALLPAGVLAAEVRAAVELQRSVGRHVAEARRDGDFPLVLSGNCNTAVGTVAALADGGRTRTGVCWFDAHADFNTPETTRSGFFDGMALAVLTGRCWRQLAAGVHGFRPVAEEDVVLFGARDVDPLEEELLASSAVAWLRAADAETHADAALRSLAGRVEQVYLHVDLDVLDPSEGRANEYAADGGLSRATLLTLVDRIRVRRGVAAAALTAYDPAFDADGRVGRAAIELAVRVVSDG